MELMTKEKKGFRRTEVGLIPEDWGLVELSDCVEFFDEKRKPVKRSDREKMSGQYPYYGASGIIDYVNDYLFDDELILLAEDGENILSRSLPIAFQVSGKVWVNNHAHVLKPKEFVDITYLTAFLESLDYSEYNSGTAQPKLNKKTCKQLPIVLPSLSEQRAIATVLSDADELLRSLDGLIAKKEAIKKGTMQQLLTGKKRLPGFDGEWEVKTLGEFADIQRGASPRPISDPRWFSEQKKVGWVRISDLTKSDGKYLYETRDYLSKEGMARSRYLESGSLIMSIAATVGLPVITCMDLCIHDGFVGFWNLRDVDQEFLFYKLKFHEPDLIEAGQTGSQNNINSDIVRNFASPFPKLAEQKAIAHILSDMDEELSALRRKREKMQRVKEGMMQELLTGRVRLV